MKLWRYLIFCKFYFFLSFQNKRCLTTLTCTMLLQVQEFLKGLDGEFLKVTVLILIRFVQLKLLPRYVSVSICVLSMQVIKCLSNYIVRGVMIPYYFGDTILRVGSQKIKIQFTFCFTIIYIFQLSKLYAATPIKHPFYARRHSNLRAHILHLVGHDHTNTFKKKKVAHQQYHLFDHTSTIIKCYLDCFFFSHF